MTWGGAERGSSPAAFAANLTSPLLLIQVRGLVHSIRKVGFVLNDNMIILLHRELNSPIVHSSPPWVSHVVAQQSIKVAALLIRSRATRMRRSTSRRRWAVCGHSARSAATGLCDALGLES